MTDIGFGNYVASGRVVAIASPESAPIKRLVQDGKEAGIVIDVTAGKKTNSVILTDSGHIVLSVLTPSEVQARLNKKSEEAQHG